jgi:hypothetical protein
MFQQLSRFGLALGLAVGALATTPASAQCSAPDNLDFGPCCAPAAVNLPSFPAMNLDALWICFDNCGPAFQRPFCGAIGKPKPVAQAGAIVCGQYDIRFQLKDCATGQLHWSAGVRATYSRTWQESSSAGTVPTTVWRFLINGDFIPTNNVPNTPCERPASLNLYSRLYLTGHIDYALDCATNTWSVAWSLNHECDQVHHAPGTVRPAPAGGFDPGKSFTIVGPGSTFVVAPNNTLVSDGPITQGSFRWNNWAASPAICTFREPAQGNFIANTQFCLCGPSTAGLQNVDSTVFAQGQCGSAVGPTPNTRFTQKRIGVWTSPTTFPGIEHLLFDFGDLRLANGCNGAQTTEWYEGVETIGGWPAFDITGVALGRQFEDLGSCNTSPTSMARRIGAPHISYSILNFNMP